MVLVPGSLVLGLFYFFAVQYYLSKAAVSGGKKVQDAIAGDFRDASNIVRKIGKNDAFIYSNEIRYIQNQEKITRKKQITAREYIELLDSSKDPNKKQVRKIRQCFIFDRQYFMVETFTNVDGSPSILRIETTNDS